MIFLYWFVNHCMVSKTMIQGEWQTIERLISHMSDAEKRELMARLASSLPAQDTDQEVRAQRESLDALRSEAAMLPVANPNDSFCSSNHDRILYGRPT